MDTTPSHVDDWRMTDRLHAQQGKGDPFAAAMRATRMPMLITDPRQDDNPIVFANDAFLKLTGYGLDEVMGQNCRFLQGEGTDRSAVAALRAAIQRREPVSLDILNYRKDGTKFWNALYMCPVTDESGELQFFFASQLDVTERKDAELRVTADKERFEKAVRERTRQLEAALEAQQTLLHEVDHRVKNNLQMVSSLIVMQSRTIKDEAVKASLRSMLERIEALSTVHRRLYQSEDVSSFDVASFVRDLVTDLMAAAGRDPKTVNFSMEPMIVSAEKATPIALMVNELVTNALKHAFPDTVDGHGSGSLAVSVKRLDGGFVIEIEDEGPGMPSEQNSGSFGTRLLRSLARQLEAEVVWKARAKGTTAAISLSAAGLEK
jgi:PAS domain S-box-containing protein